MCSSLTPRQAKEFLAKVRHIDVNCVWVQEQCAKKLVPLHMIPGEHSSADLRTKHLTLLMIKRYIASLFLEFREGRSDKAAKLHSVMRMLREESAVAKLQSTDESFASVSGGDYWAEKGEAGRWVRVHTHPIISAFLLWKVSGGPGRKTRLTPERSTRGLNSHGQQFRVDDSWERPIQSMTPTIPWTCRTIFLVDKTHTDRWGADQRRQRVEAANFQYSQSEKGSSKLDSFEEGAHTTKPRWTELSGTETSY